MMHPKDDPFQHAKKLALNQLNRRECSSSELKRYLIQKDVAVEVAEAVLTYLISYNWLNDERYAKLLARDQAAKGKGPMQIRQKLREKGIHLEMGEVQLLTEEATQKTELEAAKELVRRRFLGSKKEPAHVLQALLRRGFSYSVSRRALAILRNGSSGDDESLLENG